MKTVPLFAAVLLGAGCQTIQTPSGDEIPVMDPNALRREAIVAEGQADTFHRLADEATGFWQRGLETGEDLLSAFGAPAAAGSVLGALGGWMVPTPGQRRRERHAASEAVSEGAED